MGKKLTVGEIGQHVINNPNTGFDQCCKCQGVETQGAMTSIGDALATGALATGVIESKTYTVDDLICDECGTDDGLPEEVKDCIKEGAHLRSCDDDGFCNNCGHQEGDEFEDGPLVDWEVPVTRVSIGLRTITVKARSEERAIAEAIDAAGVYRYTQKSSDYSAPDGATKL